jgi:hypothetical protein
MQEYPSLVANGEFVPLDPAIIATMDDDRRALYDAAVNAHAAAVVASNGLAAAQATVKELEQEASDLDHIRKAMPRPTFHDLWRETRGRK